MAIEIPQETNRGYSIKAISFDPPVTSTVVTNPETTIYSRAIEAGKMGTSKEMSFNIFCNLTTGAVAAPTLTLKVKLGTGTLTIMNALSLGLGAASVPFRIEGAVINTSNSAAQYVWARLHTPSSTVPISLSAGAAYMNTDWTVDTSVNQTFSVTAQFGGLIAGTSLATKYIKIDLT